MKSKKKISLVFFLSIFTLLFLSCKKDDKNSSILWILASLNPGVSVTGTLTFSPSPGTYFSNQNVTISSQLADATVCYTSDGTTSPVCDSSAKCTTGNTYSSQISVTGAPGSNVSTTLKAISCKAQLPNSDVIAASYTIATPRNLTISKAGTGTGTITSSPAGISCGSDCSEIYPQGTSVTLSAISDAASIFAGWSGGGCSGTGACIVTLNAATTVTATFNATLIVTKSGTGTGTVTSSPFGINCGGDCSEIYALSTFITLTAAPAPGSTFVGWSGGGCSGTGLCTLTFNAATTVNAIFNQ